MIEPTDEMLAAFAAHLREPIPVRERPERIRAGLAAVLAIVERDYRVLSGRSAFPEGMHSHGAQCEDDCDVTWEADMAPFAVEHPSGLRQYIDMVDAEVAARRWKTEVLYRHSGVGLYLPTPDNAT